MRTLLNQTIKPTENPLPVDGYGNRIQIGSEVVYNLSGAIALGKIIAIPKWEWVKDYYPEWWRFKTQFKIELTRPCEGHEVGHISTVNRPQSLMLLEDIV